jgi:hypothetical protein
MRFATIILFCAVLCGCVVPTPRITTNTVTFHNLHGPVKGETFVILPTKDQEGSLEFDTYVPMLRAQLVKQGMVEVPFDQAKYSVFLRYSIDNGRTVVQSTPVYNISGGNTTYSSGTVYSAYGSANYNTSTYHPVSIDTVGTSTSSHVEYMRRVTVEFLDAARSLKEQKAVKVYEARGASQGTRGNIAGVMPTMLESMFKGFPAASGANQKDTITLPSK